MPESLVSLGSNLGDSEATLDAAEHALRGLDDSGTLVASDRLVTAPVGGVEGQREFVNAVVKFSTDLDCHTLLGRLQAIENSLGRRRGDRWDARTIDVDLLLHGHEMHDSPGLRVPHPRMTFRPFVLEPACQLAHDWVHPECGAPLSLLWGRLVSGRNAVRLIGDVRGKVAGWIADSCWSSVALEQDESMAEPPRLTIDLRDASERGISPGPRLALADCPLEHWRDEVEAAMQCVWPDEQG